MCGIAGILYKGASADAKVGKALVDMLDGCQHRGPDSTGFSLYRESRPGHLRLRFIVGEGDAAEETGQRHVGDEARRVRTDQHAGDEVTHQRGQARAAGDEAEHERQTERCGEGDDQRHRCMHGDNHTTPAPGRAV